MATSTTSLKACIPMVKSIFRRRTMGFCPCMLLVTRMFCVSCPELLGGRMLDATGAMLSWMNLGTAACMEKPEARVMVTDLGVVVQNMVQGPAGLLRSARFFPSEASLKCVTRASTATATAL